MMPDEREKELPHEFDRIVPDEIEQRAQQALRERPALSIRVRLMLGFLLFFLLTGAMILSTTIILKRLNNKTQFLVIADRYTNEIQQARRFEKNYFLYGTNLGDAFEHVLTAQKLMESSRAELESVLGSENLITMSNHLEQYHNLLKQLESFDSEMKDDNSQEFHEIEEKLRQHGAMMVSFALDLSEGERKSVRTMFHWARRVPLIFLGFLLVLAIYEANFISRQMIGRLTRLMGLTKRIAEGDFTPIMPERKYRDEFSNVNMALNSMMQQLNRHQEIMIQSHKLRAVGSLTAGVAHELNNPLNNITLTAAMLEEDYADLNDEQRLEMVRDLVAEAERSERIVRNLLDFARESEIKTEPLNIRQLLEETIKLAANQIKLHKVQLVFNTSDSASMIHGDRQQLSQVFLNLILNALDAMTRGGILEISIERSKSSDFVITRISDNGSGIPAHILPRIFDPFFTTKPTGKGTGLGLSVSLGIIKQHGGDIQVRSTVGEGTVFSVLLPVAEVPAEITTRKTE